MTWQGTPITDLEDHIHLLRRQRLMLVNALGFAMANAKHWRKGAKTALEYAKKEWPDK